MIYKLFPTFKWIFKGGLKEGLQTLGFIALFCWAMTVSLTVIVFGDHVDHERQAAWRLHYHTTEVWPELQRHKR